MRVALDAQLTVGTATGIGEYVRGLSSALRKAGVDVVPLEAPNFDPWRFDRRVLWDQALLPARAASARADLLHCASGTMPLVRTLPTVVTVHDVAWLRAQAHARPYARAYFGAFSLALYSRARRIIVDSRFSRDELVALAHIDPARIDVVYPGVSEEIMRIERQADERAFILAVGTVEKRKNLEVVIRALRDLEGVVLLSIGPSTPYRAECERIARECGVLGRVKFRGYVSREELLQLYAHAAVAVVPSTYEGFGYGVAQALCAGVPCVAAAASSLPEVAGSSAALLDPHDVAAWSKALAAELGNRDAADIRAARARVEAIERFSWEASAAAMVSSYQVALGS